MTIYRTLKFFTLVGFSLFAAPVFAADVAPKAWVVDPAASSIAFTGSHAGQEFHGQFTDWKASIRFEPGNLASNASVTIKTGSAETGNPMYDGTLPGPDWFGSNKFPVARFQSRSIKPTGNDTYEVNGLLTIRDETHPIAFPATISMVDGVAVLSAKFTLNRLDYGIGKIPDGTAAWVSRDIALDLKVTAKPEQP